MKAEYTIVLVLTVASPFILSFDRKLKFYRNLPALLKTIVVVCVPFWIWDIVATARGHWSFNPSYTLGLNLLNLPIEEWMFFVVVSFVSIFTWESAKHFAGKKK